MFKNSRKLLAFAFFSSVSWAEFCAEGVFFTADNGEQSVELCLLEETNGIYFSSAKLSARVYLKKTMKMHELLMPDFFSIQYGEVLGPDVGKWSFDSELGTHPLSIETKFLDESQINNLDVKVADLKAVLKLKIGEWLWQKDFSAIYQEIEAIRRDNSYLMAGKFISQALSQGVLQTAALAPESQEN